MLLTLMEAGFTYKVTRTCGHEERVQVYGKSARRQAQLAAERNKSCKQCLAVETRTGLVQ